MDPESNGKIFLNGIKADQSNQFYIDGKKSTGNEVIRIDILRTMCFISLILREFKTYIYLCITKDKLCEGITTA
jgi:hypothetical protein